MNKKNLSHYRDPFYRRDKALSFDTIGEEDIMKMSLQEQKDWFITAYLRNVRPYVRYKKYFEWLKRQGKDDNILFAIIKNMYGSYVLTGQWSTEKFMSVLDIMFHRRLNFSSFIFDKIGLEWERMNK